MSEKARYRYARLPVPFSYRMRIWLHQIKNAIREFPSDTCSEMVELMPGDEGYEDAPFAMQMIKGPSFTYSDGKYEPVCEE